ncbi:ribosome small subunit-dependent GTPase A [Turicibacter sp. TJ11]|uniref:ribosome small subunit-dependent GTPase A n=1 Tax=Turicibacter sp. TJ11 TaxID=2806443 RepID=UPI001F28DEA3|nr:ribosome small subunit-dependent GTPase A [Turicibacter sp. TJ11]
MKKGIILKALSGFYYVEDQETKEMIQCRSRGLFRKQKITPLVGDHVEFLVEPDGNGYVMDIGPRKNELVRPPIANVDLALVVFSVKEPDFSPKLLDRFLAVIEMNQIEPIIVLTKMDLLSEEERQAIDSSIQYYKQIGYEVIETSSKQHAGINVVNDLIKDRIVVICGQSGVGKSSLLNAIDQTLKIQVNEISKALGRGKHTTRHVELHKLSDGLIADTPGFSSLDLDQLEAIDLSQCFVEFYERSEQCKFRGCLHENEPRCAVKAAVETGEILPTRYENYLQFLTEIKSRKPKY